MLKNRKQFFAPYNQVLSNIDELFEREELSAAPDPGWPDCFNSGVFVYRPSIETYNQLLQFATEKGSFDGMYSFVFQCKLDHSGNGGWVGSVMRYVSWGL